MNTISKILLSIMFIWVSFIYSQNNVTTENKNGLTTVTFNTPNGKIKVQLPENIHSGDVISGTVITEPKGKNERITKKNKTILNGYVITINEKKTTDKKITFTIPEDITSTPQKIKIFNKKNKLFESFDIPITEPIRVPPELPKIAIPDYLRSGYLQSIQGDFDGDFSNSSLKINGDNIDIIAESPERMIFELPDTYEDFVELEITDNQIDVVTYLSIINLNLAVDKFNLLKGESTNLHIEVTGLDEMEKPIPINLENYSPKNVELEGGNTQLIIIEPDSSINEGTYYTSLKITALQSGGFSISASIPEPEMEYYSFLLPKELLQTQHKEKKKEDANLCNKKSKTKWKTVKSDQKVIYDEKKSKRASKGKCPVCKKSVSWTYYTISYYIDRHQEQKVVDCKKVAGHEGPHDFTINKRVKRKFYKKIKNKRGGCHSLIKKAGSTWKELK